MNIGGFEREDEYTRRRSSPAWWNPNHDAGQARPCTHTSTPKVLLSDTGYSDSLFELLACPDCHAQWQTWLEG